MYDSITELAKRQTDSWAEELRRSDRWLKGSTQRELFAFLNKRETLCTPGFLLRRHIQANFPHLMREAEKCSGVGIGEYQDLTNAGNVPWPGELIKCLAKILSKTEFEGFGVGKLGIDSRQWLRYLDEQGTCNRETAVKLIFALDMDDAAAAKFLLASGRDTLSVRNPFDFICKFCLEHTPRLPYSKALEMLERWEELCASTEDGMEGSGNTPSVQYGMTSAMTDAVLSLLGREGDQTDALIAYMVQHRNEFTAQYEKKNQRKKAEADKQYEYASGFSMQNIRMLRVLLKYLAVLYPADVMEVQDQAVNVSVETDEQGVPVVYSRLISAMFTMQNIEFMDHLEMDLPSKGREKRAYDQIPFQESIVLPLKNLASTLRAMTRAAEVPANARDVNRGTILLLAYFFITGYQYIPRNGDPMPSLGMEERLEEDIKLAEEGKDRAAGRILHTLQDVTDRLYDAEDDPSGVYISCLNQFLSCFGFSTFYPPFVLDRFVLLCLLADPMNAPLDSEGMLQYLMQLVISESYLLSRDRITGERSEK